MSPGGRHDIRIAAACGGTLKELLTVRELASGDLLLRMKGAGFTVELAGRRHRVDEQRFSLHRGPDPHRIALKHSLRLTDGRVATLATFIADERETRAWPIASRLVPDLRAACYDLKPRRGETVAPIATYEPAAASLCYTIVAHRGQRVAPPGNDRGAALTVMTFREFGLSIVSRLVPEPSGDGALMHHNGRSPIAGASAQRISEQALADLFEEAAGELAIARDRPSQRARIAG